jgi:hypothetical protein
MLTTAQRIAAYRRQSPGRLRLTTAQHRRMRKHAVVPSSDYTAAIAYDSRQVAAARRANPCTGCHGVGRGIPAGGQLVLPPAGWTGRTGTTTCPRCGGTGEDPDWIAEYGCCAHEAGPGHDGPCTWKCTTCAGAGHCPDCDGTGGPDDVVQCERCEGSGSCPDGCFEGWQVDE